MIGACQKNEIIRNRRELSGCIDYILQLSILEKRCSLGREIFAPTPLLLLSLELLYVYSCLFSLCASLSVCLSSRKPFFAGAAAATLLELSFLAGLLRQQIQRVRFKKKENKKSHHDIAVQHW